MFYFNGFYNISFSNLSKFISNKLRRSTAKGIDLVITTVLKNDKANIEKTSTKDEPYSNRVEINKDFNDINIFDKYENMLIFKSTASDYEIYDWIIPKNEPG